MRDAYKNKLYNSLSITDKVIADKILLGTTTYSDWGIIESSSSYNTFILLQLYYFITTP